MFKPEASVSSYSISDLEIFLELAARESFSSAARSLGVTTSAISKRIAVLEARVGLRLVQRTTRKISLTPEGNLVLHHARTIVNELAQLDETVNSSRDEPRGLVRVNATFRFGREHIASAIAKAKRKYPKLTVELLLSDRPLDPIREGIDLTIQFGSPPNARVIAKKLHGNRRFLCASPDYLQKRGCPKTLQDLADHTCIVLKQNQDLFDNWHLTRRGKSESVRVAGDLSTNDGEVALRWVLDGLGIMLRSEWDIAELVRGGRLRIVLPDYSEQNADIYAIYQQGATPPLKVKALLEMLHEHVKDHSAELTIPTSRYG
jgi:LysR family transcriptional activator of dmlA